MKYVMSYLVPALIFVIIQTTLSSSGIMLGALPTVLIFCLLLFAGKKLGDNWDNDHSRKK